MHMQMHCNWWCHWCTYLSESKLVNVYNSYSYSNADIDTHIPANSTCAYMHALEYYPRVAIRHVCMQNDHILSRRYQTIWIVRYSIDKEMDC